MYRSRFNLFILLLMIISVLEAQKQKPLIIGLSGGTGSGKSTLARKIQQLHPERCAVVALDDYYKSTKDLSVEEKSNYNYDHPDAIDFAKLVNDIHALKEGKSIRCPDFSYCNPTRPIGTMIHSKEVIIIEGFLLLHNAVVRELLDLILFVDILDEQERLRRLIKRNLEERQESVADSTRRYVDHIKPMHDQFIEPTKKYADIIIVNQDHHDKALRVISTFITSSWSSYEKPPSN